MFRITASCTGLTEEEGLSAAWDIVAEFLNRPWHLNPTCRWESNELILVVENDYDAKGLAVLDEFSDAVHACVNYSGSISFSIKSIVES